MRMVKMVKAADLVAPRGELLDASTPARSARCALLREIGIADAILGREPAGKLEVIDAHLCRDRDKGKLFARHDRTAAEND
jgi:hypothetical protein